MKRLRPADGETSRRGKQKQRITSQRLAESCDDDDHNSDIELDADRKSNDAENIDALNRRQGVTFEGGDVDSDDPDDRAESLDFTQPDYALLETSSQSTCAQESDTAKSKAPSMPAKVGQLSAKAIEELTSQLVRYMLYKAGLKLPIKFADISKDVFPKHKNVSRYFFQKAKRQLEKVFGYRVLSVDDSGTKEMYIILNSATSQEHLLLVNKNGRASTRGFLMMVLGILWCAPGRQLSEDDLWKQLKLLDSTIKPNKEHIQLGDIAQLLKTFENQMYLHSTAELDADLKKVKFYGYGARTLLEVGKVQILNFVCKLITGRPPSEVQIDEVNLEAS